MTDTLEYALMAGGSYISNRNPKNQFPAPLGWTSYLEDGKNFASSGFEGSLCS